MKTTSAPKRAEKYEIMAPAQGPKVYPDKMISVEYNGIGGMVVKKIRKNMTACPYDSSARNQNESSSRRANSSVL